MLSLRKTRRAPILERYQILANGCWQWLGTIDRDGYGTTYHKGQRNRRAHRVVYEMLVGPIPAGMELDHTCRNRACVNPDHHQPTTHRVNTLRSHGITAANARKTHCVNGHPFTPENTKIEDGGARRCIACRRARDAKKGGRHA